MTIVICVQVPEQRLHQQASLGGRVVAAVFSVQWPLAGPERQEHVLQMGIAGHGACVAWKSRESDCSETQPLGPSNAQSLSSVMNSMARYDPCLSICPAVHPAVVYRACNTHCPWCQHEDLPNLQCLLRDGSAVRARWAAGGGGRLQCSPPHSML